MKLGHLTLPLLLTITGTAWASDATFHRVNSEIIQTKCILCHDGSDTPDDFSTYDLLMSHTGDVVPHDPANSGIYVKTSTGKMPPPNHGGPLSQDEINLIQQWIQDGALNN